MMTPDEMIVVIKAAADGKQLQYRNNTAMPTSPWKDRGPYETYNNLNFGNYDYRIKPEKKKLYVVLNKNDARVATSEYEDVINKHLDYLINTSEYGPYRIVTFVEE